MYVFEMCGIEIFYGEEIELFGVNGVVELIEDCVGDVRVYMMFDIDCFDLVFVFGIGMLVVGGLFF